jgi:FkbM family methyltransferase
MGLFGTTRFIFSHPVGKRAPLRALVRFAAWQVAIRTSPGAIAVPFVNGSRLLMERGMTGATGNIYVGLHEFADMAFVLHALRRDDLFLDVGANVGSYTVLAAKAVGCSCISVEPIPATVRRLRDNLALNHILDRVEVHECAAGERDGSVRMTTHGASVNHIVVAPTTETTTEVRLRTLDGLLGDRSPNMLKMDVEGYELAALRGAHEVLSRPSLSACIIETLGAGEASDRERGPMTALLEAHEFRPADYDPWQRRLTPLDRPNAVGNTIYVRDWTTLAERVRSAPTFEVLGQSC